MKKFWNVVAILAVLAGVSVDVRATEPEDEMVSVGEITEASGDAEKTVVPVDEKVLIGEITEGSYDAEEVVILAEDVEDGKGKARPRYTDLSRSRKKNTDEKNVDEKESGGIEYHGYVNVGGQFNTHGAAYNLTGANTDNDFGLDGAYLSITKKARTGDGVIDYGFGTDVMFGRDARLMHGKSGWDEKWITGHSSSNYNGYADVEMDSYGFATPQLYAEMSLNHLTFKGGHFYTPFGCESVRADQRFFYSLGRTFETAPITHTGALFSWDRIRNVNITLGWVMGENNMFEQASGEFGDDYSESLLLGSFQVTPNRLVDLKYNFEVGTGAIQGWEGDLFRQEVIWQSQLSRRWSSAFLFGTGRFTGNENLGGASWSGDITMLMPLTGASGVEYQTWAGYLYYTMNQYWKFGGRVELQHGQTLGAARFSRSQNADQMDVDLFDMTFGANWTPTGKDGFVVRPEIRYDHASEPVFGSRTKATAGHEDQLSLGCDVMFRF
ncbi:MAG: outer membrane beta-barrel protein [Planctomycetia bacterium]|nr:outer membrane beta-barrel protein [Planctomycetia bacterium]